MAMGNAGFDTDSIESEAIAGRTIVAALIGGTAGSLTGGKFANGATTKCSSYELSEKIAGWRDAERAVRSRLREDEWTTK